MKRACTFLKGVTAGGVLVAALVVPGLLPAWAQETTTATSSTTTTVKKAPRTSATPQMIEDAIERSKSRTDRFKATGIPERFGSEDPTRFSTK